MPWILISPLNLIIDYSGDVEINLCFKIIVTLGNEMNTAEYTIKFDDGACL